MSVNVNTIKVMYIWAISAVLNIHISPSKPQTITLIFLIQTLRSQSLPFRAFPSAPFTQSLPLRAFHSEPPPQRLPFRATTAEPPLSTSPCPFPSEPPAQILPLHGSHSLPLPTPPSPSDPPIHILQLKLSNSASPFRACQAYISKP